MAILKIKLRAYLPVGGKIVNDLFGYIATMVYDGSEIRVISPDKNVETIITHRINSTIDSLKKDLEFFSDDFSFNEAVKNVRFINLCAMTPAEDFKSVNGENLLVAVFSPALYKKDEQSNIDVIPQDKSVTIGPFFDLKEIAMCMWRLFSDDEKASWVFLNKVDPTHWKQNDIDLEDREFKYLSDYLNSWKGKTGDKDKDDFIYDFIMSVLLKDEEHEISDQKKAFFKKALERIWNDDLSWIAVGKRADK